MTLDGLTLSACVKELQSQAADAKIQKVQMPGKEEVVLSLYSAQAGSFRLCISADAGDCGIYITTQQKPNPKTPSSFCMFLRKYLTGAILQSIEQTGLNRVVTLTLSAKDEMLHPISLKLIVEIMGKYSNLILTNADGKILDSIKRVSFDLSSKRQILPGMQYENPPQQKANPLALSHVSFLEALQTHTEKRLDAHILSVFDGISTQTAQEVLHRCGITQTQTQELSQKQWERLATVMQEFLQSATAQPHPCVQHNADGLPVFFSLVEYQTYPPQTRKYFDSVNAMLDYYYARRLEIFRITQQKDSLMRVISKAYSKLNKLIAIYQNSIEDEKKAEKLRNKADYITANLYQLKKGMSHFDAYDYETGEPVRIELDLSLTPQQQAQKIYKKVTKLKTAAKINRAKLSDALDEREFLEGVMHFIDTADKESDIADLKYTLAKEGYLSAPPKNKKEVTQISEPLQFCSPSGYTILVGKNDRQNDQLTMGTASKDDIWFHAQKIPGSHVLLVTEGTDLYEIDDETIVMAAQLAAKFSRAKQSGKTPVDYTQRKNVKKPPASRPGKVIYNDYFTVYVNAGDQA